MENLTNIIEIGPADIGIFWNKNSSVPVDESGCNQWAIIVDENTVLTIPTKNDVRTEDYPNKYPVEEISLSLLLEQENLMLIENRFPHLQNQIVGFFLKHKNNLTYFEAAQKHLFFGNTYPFETGELFPSKPSYDNDTEFDAAWVELLETARPLDMLLTLNKKIF